MPFVFCPHTGCGCKASYDAVKPTQCPQCHKAFAAAFKPVSSVTVVHAAVDDTPDDPPRTRSALTARQRAGITTQVKPRRGREDTAALANVMNPPADLPELPTDAGDDEEYDENVNPREVRRLARELAAAIDPSTIVVRDDDDGVFRFTQFVEEAKRTKQPAAAKTRRRR